MNLSKTVTQKQNQKRTIQVEKGAKPQRYINERMTDKDYSGENLLPPIKGQRKQYSDSHCDHNHDPRNFRPRSDQAVDYKDGPGVQEERINPSRENIKIVVRPRPLLDFENRRGDYSCVNVLSETGMEVVGFEGAKQFKFNQVLKPHLTQGEAFHCLGVQPLLDTAIEGYSSTILAYGQTGSGKTFT